MLYELYHTYILYVITVQGKQLEVMLGPPRGGMTKAWRGPQNEGLFCVSRIYNS